MAPLKFRIWDRENNNFDTEDICSHQDGSLMCDEGRTLFSRNQFEISYSTGLKYDDGKEIYDGDIICILAGYYKHIYEVYFCEDCAAFCTRDRRGNEFFLITSIKGHFPDDIVKITYLGNKYENPELFEELKCN